MKKGFSFMETIISVTLVSIIITPVITGFYISRLKEIKYMEIFEKSIDLNNRLLNLSNSKTYEYLSEEYTGEEEDGYKYAYSFSNLNGDIINSFGDELVVNPNVSGIWESNIPNYSNYLILEDSMLDGNNYYIGENFETLFIDNNCTKDINIIMDTKRDTILNIRNISDRNINILVYSGLVIENFLDNDYKKYILNISFYTEDEKFINSLTNIVKFKIGE